MRLYPVTDFRKKDAEYLKKAIANMAARGFHAAHISEVCGTTLPSTSYWIRQAGVRLKDYRDGKGEVASAALRECVDAWRLKIIGRGGA